MQLFDKLKQGLTKTKRLLGTDFRGLFKADGRLVDEAFLDDLFETLIKIDMGADTAQSIVDEIRSTFRARVVELQFILEQVNGILDRLRQSQSPGK